LVRAVRDHRHNVFEEHAEIEVDRFQVELPGLDLRKIEDVIDDREHPSAVLPTPAAYLRCSRSRSVPSNGSLRPMTAFIGVRISWLIDAKNCDFSRGASIA